MSSLPANVARSRRRPPTPPPSDEAGDARLPPAPGAARQLPVKADAGQAPLETPDGLVYVSDDSPGYRRLRRGKGFVYCEPDGSRVTDPEQIRRINRLAIPPAYKDVWICRAPNGHLQATGRDDRGRKQYRYHADWRVARDEGKFSRMLEFGRALPRIRARVTRDLKVPLGKHLTRRSVLATVVRLLDTTLVRVGNEEYARANGSFGLTTLRNRHAAVDGSALRLHFRGKSGVVHDAFLDDPRVAKVVRRCQSLRGQDLFQYQDENGQIHGVGSADVNDYLREASGADFTAKDFRTWHASVHALDLWRESRGGGPLTRVAVNDLLRQVAGRLGNTVAVCRKSYVHPRVLQALVDTSPLEEDEVDDVAAKQARRTGLNRAERDFLAFLARPC